MNVVQYISILFLLIAYQAAGQPKTLYDFRAPDINGDTVDFSVFRGKKVLIVNTATGCALAPQIQKMQELYEEYGGDDFEIIAFPSNDFGSQEPGNNEQIREICEQKFHVSFLIMEKITIKGENGHPIYQWLTNSELNGQLDGKVIWNFQKFLIDEKGHPVDFLSPITGPQNRRIIEWLQEGQ